MLRVFASSLLILSLAGCSFASATGRTVPVKVVSVCAECGHTNIVRTSMNRVTVRAYSIFEKADAIVKSLRVVAAQSGSLAIGVTGVNLNADAQMPQVLGALGPLLGGILKAFFM